MGYPPLTFNIVPMVGSVSMIRLLGTFTYACRYADSSLRRAGAPVNHQSGQRGQGMVEYLLVLTVIVTMTMTAMSTISGSVGNLTSALVNNIQEVTGVEAP